jgi:hypothetical protein
MTEVYAIPPEIMRDIASRHDVEQEIFSKGSTHIYIELRQTLENIDKKYFGDQDGSNDKAKSRGDQ